MKSVPFEDKSKRNILLLFCKPEVGDGEGCSSVPLVSPDNRMEECACSVLALTARTCKVCSILTAVN